MSWFLKYRPRQIADLDLTDVRQHFLQLMEHGQFPQTLLFSGPKGTGKTSASRIIGAMLNDPANRKAVQALFFEKKNDAALSLQEPDPDSEFSQQVFKGQSYVVQEIDAASHRGIDHIRQLKERIYMQPQEGIMSVYILDEVHMLTNEAFNALLKILEEPPAHVIFILATTELHKVPATIVSRCNLVSFRKANIKELVSRLKKILKQEKIDYEAEALEEIALRSDGSFRDAVKLAEIAAQNEEITLQAIDNLIGGSALVEVKKLVELILVKDEASISQFFDELRQRNFDQEYFYQTLFNYLHQDLLAAIGAVDKEPQLSKEVSLFLLNQLSAIDLNQNSPINFLPLELRLLLLITKSKTGSDSSDSNSNKTRNKSKKKAKNLTKNKKDKANSRDQVKHSQTKQVKIKTKIKKTDSLDISANDGKNKQSAAVKTESIATPEYQAQSQSLSQSLCDRWDDFLQVVEKNNSTLAALLRSSKPKSSANGVTKIMVYYRFHQEQLNQPKFKNIIENCGQKIVGDKVRFKFVLTEPKIEPDLVDVPAKTETLVDLAEEALL